MKKIRGEHLAVIALWLGVVVGAGLGEATSSLDRANIEVALRTQNNEHASELLDRYLEQMPDDHAMLYNAACVRCRLGDSAGAVARLREAVRAGFVDFSHMRRDPDLEPLHGTPTWNAFMAARRAADAILATRRRSEWVDARDASRYRTGDDVERRLLFAAALDDQGMTTLGMTAGRFCDHLVETLFQTPLAHAVLVTVPHADDIEEMFDDAHIRGAYQHGLRRIVASDLGRSLRHELVHALHHHHMDEIGQIHPYWLQEGLAAHLEALAITDAGPRRLPSTRLMTARRLAEADELVPWSQFLALTTTAFRSDPAHHYATAASIMSFLDDHDRLREWYERYVATYDVDPTGQHAFTLVFDQPIEAVEEAWRTWLLTEAKVIADDGPVEGPPPPDATAIGSVEPPACAAHVAAHQAARADYAEGRLNEAIETLETIVHAYPGFADARYTLGLAYVRTHDLAAARRERDQLIGLDPSLGSLLTNLVMSSRR